MEPGLGREDVASDRFASADLASLGGVMFVSISGWERRRRLRPRCKGDLYLYTHVSLVIVPGRLGLTAYP